MLFQSHKTSSSEHKLRYVWWNPRAFWTCIDSSATTTFKAQKGSFWAKHVWVNYLFKKFVVPFSYVEVMKTTSTGLFREFFFFPIFPSSGGRVEQKQSPEVSAGRRGGLWVVGLSERSCWGGRSEGLLHTHHSVPTQSFSPAQSARQTSPRISSTATHRQVLDLCFR